MFAPEQPMKTVFITYNQAYHEIIVRLLTQDEPPWLHLLRAGSGPWLEDGGAAYRMTMLGLR